MSNEVMAREDYPPIPAPPPRNVLSYLQFFHPKANKAEDILAAIPSVQEGDLVLMGDRPRLPSAQARYWLLAAFWYETDNDATGRPVLYAPCGTGLKKENVTCLLAMCENGQVLPVSMRTDQARTAAIRHATNLVQNAKLPAELNPKYREKLAALPPMFWYSFQLRVLAPRTSRATGVAYRPSAIAAQALTTMDEFLLLQEAAPALSDARRLFDERVKEIQKQF